MRAKRQNQGNKDSRKVFRTERKKNMETALKRKERHKEKVRDKGGLYADLWLGTNAFGKFMSEAAPVFRLLVSSYLPI